MRYLVLSDIHANRPALEAVLADARRQGFDAALLLGDVVGYGAEPGACIAHLRALGLAGAVRGNHDKVAAGLEPARLFHEHARVAIEWTRDVLTDDERRWLAALPVGPAGVTADLMLCHGAPYDEDAYLFDEGDAWRAFADGVGGLCLYGHTHVPAAFAAEGRRPSALLPDPVEGAAGTAARLQWDRTRAWLVNVGSIGQPRDGDPRAAYGLFDASTGVVEFRRVEYDIKAAQEAIRAARLPERLATRLDRGA